MAEIEFEPEFFNRTLLTAGLTENQVREIAIEFSRNNYVIEDETLLEYLMSTGIDMSSIISIFSKLGIGKATAVKMIEMKQQKKLGKTVQIYGLEVIE
ncbi:hypothetical protein JXA56_02410 [Candidatus Micrarchaeota archaeon]|nr:hypothetical protein [Candidatus Micrarchaeota archaeon]